jgi:histidinol dehydrogenase
MKVVAASDAAALSGLLDAGWRAPEPVVNEVAQILADVGARGDSAVVEYARRFDDEGYDLSKLRVAIPMLQGARPLVSPEIGAALELAKERITRFHQRQRQSDIAYVEEDGTRYAVQRRPLRSVAVYAPRSGGAVAVLMGAVPARIAGVSRVVVLSPAAADGLPAPVLLACALSGVDELYAIGGAQAIAAAAFGTDSIASVDKIVGRGGVWTTEAKRQVFGRCGVDALAGPTEVLIVADEGANSEYVAGELLAQAERPGVTRLAVLSESRPLLEAVAQLIDTLDPRTLEGYEFVSDAISTHCRLIQASTRDELFELLNRFAPAYLCLHVRDASAYLERIYAAGTVFVGDMTPLVSGEYLAGTSRVVPTSGTARFTSSLSLADFTRSLSVVENTSERMASDAPVLASLAELDDLPHHAQTARMRSDN